MTVIIDLKVKKPPEGVTVRAWREVLRHAFVAAGRFWHETMLPKHFGPDAARHYPGVYAKRTSKYLARKLKISPQMIRNAMVISRDVKRNSREYWREYYRALERLIGARGGNTWLVFSGTLQRLSQLATFRAFPSRFSVVMQGTKYTPKRNKPGSTQPHLQGELLATTKTEREALRRIVTKTVAEGLKHLAANGSIPAAPRRGLF